MNQRTRCSLVQIQLMKGQASSQIRCKGITQVQVQIFHFSGELSWFSSFFFSLQVDILFSACVICFYFCEWD